MQYDPDIINQRTGMRMKRRAGIIPVPKELIDANTLSQENFPTTPAMLVGRSNVTSMDPPKFAICAETNWGVGAT